MLGFAFQQLRAHHGKRGIRKKTTKKRNGQWTITATSKEDDLIAEDDDCVMEEEDVLVASIPSLVLSYMIEKHLVQSSCVALALSGAFRGFSSLFRRGSRYIHYKKAI